MSVETGAHLMRHILVLLLVVAWTIEIVKSKHLVGHLRQVVALAHRNGFVFSLQLFTVPAIDWKIATFWRRQLVDKSFFLYAEGSLGLVQLFLSYRVFNKCRRMHLLAFFSGLNTILIQKIQKC